jgi:hypothetical protein
MLTVSEELSSTLQLAADRVNFTRGLNHPSIFSSQASEEQLSSTRQKVPGSPNTAREKY